VRSKNLEVTVACPYCHTSLEPRRLLVMYWVIVLYEGKRFVGITVATLKILGTMPCEVWCISPVYTCMIFNVILFLVWACARYVLH
jgi:hypothetical protein